MNLANYKTSTDYGELWELVQTQEVACVIPSPQHSFYRFHFHNVLELIVWWGGLALSKEDFISQCQSCNLKWLVPEEVKTIRNCDTCFYEKGSQACVFCVPMAPVKMSNWRPKESEGDNA